MEDSILSVATIIISVITSSLFTLVLSVFILDPIKEKKKYVFDEKKQVYESIIVFCHVTEDVMQDVVNCMNKSAMMVHPCASH